jgi:hypothetical protein
MVSPLIVHSAVCFYIVTIIHTEIALWADAITRDRARKRIETGRVQLLLHLARCQGWKERERG